MSINDDLFNKEYNFDFHFENKIISLPLTLIHKQDNVDIYYLEVINEPKVTHDWFDLFRSSFPDKDPILHIVSELNNHVVFNAERPFSKIKTNNGVITGKVELSSFELNETQVKLVNNLCYFYPSSFGRIELSDIESTISNKVLTDFGISNSVIVRYKISSGYLTLEWEFTNKSDDNETILLCSDMLAQTLSYLLTFAKASKVEWSHRQSFNNKDLINLKYFQVNILRENKNLTSSFYGQMWDSFISQNFGQYDITYYKSTAIFASVHLLAINNMDESMYFMHMAALDALVTSHTKAKKKLHIIEPQKFTEIKNYLKLQLSVFFNNHNILSINADDSKKINKKFTNIVNIANDLSFKEKVEFTFNSLGLTDYYKENEQQIKKSIDARNRIMHEGWVEDWSKYKSDSLVESCFIIREAVQLIILRILDYQGDIYSIRCNDDIDTLTKVGDVKANG